MHVDELGDSHCLPAAWHAKLERARGRCQAGQEPVS